MKTALTPVFTGTPVILHGADYNPEQWLDRSDILEQDAALMKQAGMTASSVGIFSWVSLQPAEDVFDFSWLDAAIERLHNQGVGILLATPSAATPMWLSQDAEVRRMDASRHRLEPGSRHNYCASSPRYRAAVAEIDRRLSERYGQHPALLGWHISNEFGGTYESGHCYCERCIEGFQAWLKNCFSGDLAALNRAWNTAHWSHTFQDWSQIRPFNSNSNNGLMLAWKRWCSHLFVDLLKLEKCAVRKHSDAPVTTNMHGPLDYYDHSAMAHELDFVSFDCYPTIDGSGQDVDQVAWASYYNSRMRGFKPGHPWLLMESCPTQPQWKPRMRLKRPGMHRAMSLLHVADGSDSVMYFQWRAGRNEVEKHHGAVLMQDAPPETRAFREVCELGSDLARLGGVAGSACEAPVAIVQDVHSDWSRLIGAGFRGEPTATDLVMAHHRCFHERGIHADVVPADADLISYKLVIVPCVAMLRPGFLERLAAALEAGAHVLVDALSGWYDNESAIVNGGRPGELGPLLGLDASEELDVLRFDERIPISCPDGWLRSEANAVGHCDLVRLNGAEPVATWAGEFYAGRPALTRNSRGRGTAWYLACRLEYGDLSHLLRRISDAAGITAPLPSVPSGVVVRERVQHDRRYLFVINPQPGSVVLEVGDGWDDVLGVGGLPSLLELGPHDARVLVRKR